VKIAKYHVTSLDPQDFLKKYYVKKSLVDISHVMLVMRPTLISVCIADAERCDKYIVEPEERKDTIS
jgi:hypothetical protein